MDKRQILEKILDFFHQKGIEVKNSQELENVRYLEQGWLDSFDLIDFLMYLEQEFNIELPPEVLQTDSFRTIGGVAETILKLLNGKCSDN
jgi:acyl carrier protein